MKFLTIPFSRCLGVPVGPIFVHIIIINLIFGPKNVCSWGYNSLHKGYKCLHVPTNRVYIYRDVVFDENVFPFSTMPQPRITAPSMRSSAILLGQFEDVAYSPVLLPNHSAGTDVVFAWNFYLMHHPRRRWRTLIGRSMHMHRLPPSTPSQAPRLLMHLDRRQRRPSLSGPRCCLLARSRIRHHPRRLRELPCRPPRLGR